MLRTTTGLLFAVYVTFAASLHSVTARDAELVEEPSIDPAVEEGLGPVRSPWHRDMTWADLQSTFPSNKPDVVLPDGALKLTVVQMNVDFAFCFERDEKTKALFPHHSVRKRMDDVKRTMDQSKADVFIIQEPRKFSDDTGAIVYDGIEPFREYFKDREYTFYATPRNEGWQFSLNNIIAVRETSLLKVEEVRRVPLATEEAPTGYERNRNDAVAVDLVYDKTPLTVVGVHVGLHKEHKALAFDVLKKFMATELNAGKRAVLLAGDFNTFKEQYEMLRSRTEDMKDTLAGVDTFLAYPFDGGIPKDQVVRAHTVVNCKYLQDLAPYMEKFKQNPLITRLDHCYYEGAVSHLATRTLWRGLEPDYGSESRVVDVRKLWKMVADHHVVPPSDHLPFEHVFAFYPKKEKEEDLPDAREELF